MASVPGPAERGYALLRIPGYHVLQDPAGVRCLIETTIDGRMPHLIAA